MDRHETLHGARYYDYLTGPQASEKLTNTIARYSSSKVARPHILMSQSGRPRPLHRYYSSSLSPYGACSTSHYHHLFSTFVRQHTTFDENTVFWGPETSYNIHFLELLIFARIGSHDANTSRAITLREMYGSAWNFAWCKILRLSNEVLSIREIDQHDREIFKFKSRAATHSYEPVWPA